MLNVTYFLVAFHKCILLSKNGINEISVIKEWFAILQKSLSSCRHAKSKEKKENKKLLDHTLRSAYINVKFYYWSRVIEH